MQDESEVVKLRLAEETHQTDLEALHARSLLEGSELMKRQLVDQKRLYARKMELQQIGVMKAQEKFDKETERKHLEENNAKPSSEKEFQIAKGILSCQAQIGIRTSSKRH